MAKAGREIMSLLQKRLGAGPPEPALDVYIAELDPVLASLEHGVSGQSLAGSALKALLAKVEAADIDVDSWLRHHFYFISVEASRRGGAHVAAARALEAATFPDGLSHVDDYIPDENKLCRDTIAALRSPEHAAAVTAIELPTAWTVAWEAALNESEASFAAVQKTRTDKSIHVVVGQDAEVGFVDMMFRLRRYVDSRAARSDKVKVAQGKALLAPLLDMLAKAKAEERARGTRKEHAKPAAAGDKSAPAAVVAAPAVVVGTEPAAEPSKGSGGVQVRCSRRTGVKVRYGARTPVPLAMLSARRQCDMLVVEFESSEV